MMLARLWGQSMLMRRGQHRSGSVFTRCTYEFLSSNACPKNHDHQFCCDALDSTNTMSNSKEPYFIGTSGLLFAGAISVHLSFAVASTEADFYKSSTFDGRFLKEKESALLNEHIFRCEHIQIDFFNSCLRFVVSFSYTALKRLMRSNGYKFTN